MIRRSMLSLPLAFGLVGASADGQQAPPVPPGRAYKVAFWYELDRPWSTAKYQAYDVARGEFDEKAVAAWQRTIFEKHPAMGCCVRDVSTVGEPGATEAERLASAVEHEKQRWAGLNKSPARLRPSLAGAPPTFKRKEVTRINFDLPVPGASGTPLYPSRSPFPYPYRSGPR